MYKVTIIISIIAVYESIKGKIRYFMIPLYILLRENKGN